ncbi:MAG: NAD(P)/FAD-dependent oxidoreductase [Flammeovirgaceae bacterium]
MDFDYLIIGQGIAGTNLAFTLLDHSKKVLVVDQPKPFTSTKAAAGLFNPITGRKLTKTWLADLIFPYLHQFYPQQEARLQCTFFHQIPIYIPFDSVEKQNTWVAKSGEISYHDYILQSPSEKYVGKLNTHFGGMELKQAGYVDTNSYLAAAAGFFKQHHMLQHTFITPQALNLADGKVAWKGLSFGKVIFCDGAFNADNALFDWLDYRRVKGEILRVKFQGDAFEQIINRGCWVIPQLDKTYKVGSTFEFNQLDTTPTEKGKLQVMEKLEALVTLPYEVLDHWAGIRPATYDRRPFVGLHPKYPQVGLFNGMGAKGISLTPYLAQHFYAFLEEGKPLMPEIDLNRKRKKKAKG